MATPPRNPSQVLFGLTVGPVARLHDQNEIEEQLSVVAFKAGDLQVKERRGVADAKNTNHERPLHRGRSFQKALAISAQDTAQRNKKKRVNRK